MNPTTRLLEIAQRLDEMSDEENLAELEDLSEAIGEAVEKIQRDKELAPAYETAKMPRYLAEIQRIFETALREERYGNSRGTHDLMREAMMAQVRYAMPNPNLGKIINGSMV